ncbi:transcription factor Opi1-domain-containing protein [Coniella lustricola]|uniref:Transcription factor Opi1-domain-containing protein n=1 Tax=Coniella lustricola TaxID=2025994 RepID=A0A2T3A1Q0_9PEZI|nr:transcription factor Opi1-domain-containing protein [Coniella lustricola]
MACGMVSMLLLAHNYRAQLLGTCGAIALANLLCPLLPDFVSSPQHKNPTSPATHFGTPRAPEAEPLLSLVLSSGSVLARPIEGTVTAYTTTKNFSPGFIKTPVEYVEGVVGSGFHMTGIEGGVRWFFRGKGRHPSSHDLETGENSHKRRKVDNRSSSPSRIQRGESPRVVAAFPGSRSPEIEPWGLGEKERRLSVGTIDTLPAYDDARSPAYSENALTASNEKSMANNELSAHSGSRSSSSTNNAAWQHRLMMSTSGLSIAMSEESLRSLKYCLSWLRWANDHIGRVIMALKDALEKYDNEHSSNAAMKMENGTADNSEHARNELNARVAALRSDVLKTLTGVIETVSKYTGGALPENARVLVKRHLQSLPQRFMLATKENANANAQGGNSAATTGEEAKEKDVREGAQRVVVMAKEGLDMMAQVSFVLDGTIVSAEDWCERLGRKKRDQRDDSTAQDEQQQAATRDEVQEKPQTVPFAGAPVVTDEDTKMQG